MMFQFHPRRLAGERAFLGGWGIWLACFAVMPITTVFWGEFPSITLFIAANVAVLVGILVGSTGKRGDMLVYSETLLRTALLLCVILGAIALTAKVVDLIHYRGILSARSFSEGRERMEANGENLFSGIHFLLSPVIYAGGVIAIVMLVTKRMQGIAVAALVVYALNPAFSFVYGGRSTLVLAVALAGITLLVSLPAIRARHIIGAATAFLVLFGATMFMFVGRAIEKIGTAHVEKLAGASDYTKLVPLTPQTLETMGNLPELARFGLYYLTSVGQYVLHGVFEFFWIVADKPNYQQPLWGEYQFTMYQQAQRVLFGQTGLVNLETYNPASGLFSTFWGPAYLDFGPAMIVYGLSFGLIAGWIRKQIDRGDIFALPLFALLVYQIMLIPIVNGIMASSAIILNVGLAGIWVMSRIAAARRSVPLLAATSSPEQRPGSPAPEFPSPNAA